MANGLHSTCWTMEQELAYAVAQRDSATTTWGKAHWGNEIAELERRLAHDRGAA